MGPHLKELNRSQLFGPMGATISCDGDHFFFVISSGGLIKIKLKLTSPHFHVLVSCVNVTYVPGGLVGDPRAYQDQFRGFKSHRVHARREVFLHKKNWLAESARA